MSTQLLGNTNAAQAFCCRKLVSCLVVNDTGPSNIPLRFKTGAFVLLPFALKIDAGDEVTPTCPTQWVQAHNIVPPL